MKQAFGCGLLSVPQSVTTPKQQPIVLASERDIASKHHGRGAWGKWSVRHWLTFGIFWRESESEVPMANPFFEREVSDLGVQIVLIHNTNFESGSAVIEERLLTNAAVIKPLLCNKSKKLYKLAEPILQNSSRLEAVIARNLLESDQTCQGSSVLQLDRAHDS